jgi:hypothetical protein
MRKIKSIVFNAKLYNLHQAMEAYFFQPSTEGLLVINNRFCLAKRRQDIEILWIKFCRISLFKMH